MSSLTVRDIPEEVMQRLREAATEDRRSINSQTVFWLEQAARQRMSLDERTRLVSRVRSLRRAITRRRGTGPDSAKIIRRMRDERARRRS